MNNQKLIFPRLIADFVLLALTIFSVWMILSQFFGSAAYRDSLNVIFGSTGVVYGLTFGAPFTAMIIGIYLSMRETSFKKRTIYLVIVSLNIFILGVLLVIGSIGYFFYSLLKASRPPGSIGYTVY